MSRVINVQCCDLTEPGIGTARERWHTELIRRRVDQEEEKAEGGDSAAFSGGDI